MKIAVAAQGDGLDALVSPRFGRARWILVIDPDRGVCDVLDNQPCACARAGSGVEAGDVVAATDVRAAIAGHVGPRAYRLLSGAHVSVHQAGNGVTVRDAVAAMLRGDLPVLRGPTIEGPWA